MVVDEKQCVCLLTNTFVMFPVNAAHAAQYKARMSLT
jgi:hypothetical protein